jgi:hypothetical protein
MMMWGGFSVSVTARFFDSASAFGWLKHPCPNGNQHMPIMAGSGIIIIPHNGMGKHE